MTAKGRLKGSVAFELHSCIVSCISLRSPIRIFYFNVSARACRVAYQRSDNEVISRVTVSIVRVMMWNVQCLETLHSCRAGKMRWDARNVSSCTDMHILL